MKKVNIKAILIGLFSDLVLTFIIGYLLGIYAIFKYGKGSTEFFKFAEFYSNHPLYFYTTLSIGHLIAIISGAICAIYAKENIIYNSGILGLVLAVFSIALNYDNVVIIFSSFISFPAAILGAFLVKKKIIK